MLDQNLPINLGQNITILKWKNPIFGFQCLISGPSVDYQAVQVVLSPKVLSLFCSFAISLQNLHHFGGHIAFPTLGGSRIHRRFRTPPPKCTKYCLAVSLSRKIGGEGSRIRSSLGKSTENTCRY